MPFARLSSLYIREERPGRRTARSESCGGASQGSRRPAKAPRGFCSSSGLLLTRPPALGVGLACNLAVRDGPHSRPDFNLSMTLDGWLAGAPALFAPHQRNLRADFREFVIHNSERQHAPLVVAVGAERREPYCFAALQHFVVGQ